MIKWAPPSVIKTDEQMVDYITSKAKRDEDCLIWVGTTTDDGYPKLNWKKKSYRAQRLLYKLTRLNYRPELVIVTKCGNKKCVNPDHLRLSSRETVSKTTAKRGGYPKGPARGLRAAIAVAYKSRLGIDKYQEVTQHRMEGKTWKQIGEIYGVSDSSAWSSYQRWKKMAI